MEINSTLHVFNEGDIKAGPGVAERQTVKGLIGTDERPSERIRVGLASFEPGVLEDLHWHPIEAFYYVIKGRAVLRDIQGKEYDIGPGSAVYAPPGIAGSHEWDIKEPLQLLSIRASTEPHRKLQFSVDRSTKKSRIAFKELVRRGAVDFKSLY